MKKIIAVLLILVSFFSGAAFWKAINNSNENKTEEHAAAQVFDTTRLDEWCRGDAAGTIRMVDAEWFNYEPSSGWTTLKDYEGNLWCVQSEMINENDFVLLWINDNGTKRSLEDDYLVKVWIEAH